MISKITTKYLISAFLVVALTGCSQTLNPFSSHPKYKLTPNRYKATMKEYCVLGKTYTPETVEVGDTMKGVASWYSPNFHGKYTSSGEIYNMYDYTVAHKTWPMDTLVKIVNLDNGKIQIARINDRGPFVDGRIIDCSYATGKALGLDKSGIAHVTIEVVGFNSKPIKQNSTYSASNSDTKTTKVTLSSFQLQVGAFRAVDGANQTAKKYSLLDAKHPAVVQRFSSSDGGYIYRVFITGFISENEARNFMNCNNITSGIIVSK